MFLSEISKRTRSGKPELDKTPLIEGCENIRIKYKYNLVPKNLPVYYADILLPITKNVQGKQLMLSFQQ